MYSCGSLSAGSTPSTCAASNVANATPRSWRVLQGSVPAEVSHPLAFLLGHVIAVRLVGGRNCCEPTIRADLVICRLGGGVADVVVIADGVLGLVLGIVLLVRATTHVQQSGVEDLRVGLGMQIEERGEPLPERGQSRGVAGVKLVEQREQPALLMMVVEDQISDIHARSKIADKGRA
jgi:hypothetical protein